MSAKEQLEKRPKPKPQAVPFWLGAAKKKKAPRARRETNSMRKGWV